MPNTDPRSAEDRRIALARDYVAYSSARDLARIEPMLDAAAAYRSTGVGDFDGREAILEMMAAFFARFPDVTWQAEHFRALGADGVEFDFVMRATDRDSGDVIARQGVERIFFTAAGLIRTIEVEARPMSGRGDLSIRPASRAEFDIVIDWAADEGWNPGRADGDLFHATDPEGFLIGRLDGEPVCAISVVAYDAAFGFLGFYIVKLGHRGHGHGLRIWRAGMARLAGRTVGLDGVVDQQDNYRKSGFVLAHRNIRYGGVAAAARAVAASGAVADAADLPFDTIAAYDAPFFAAPRTGFLARWLNAPAHVVKALMRGGRVAGYGVIRPCREGSKIGPLFADDAAAADDLFRALAGSAGGGPVFLDTPEPNGEALALARRHGLAPCFETARMYAGPAPDLPLDRTYGITTFELG